MGIKKKYLWNSNKNEFEEKDIVDNTKKFNYVEYLNEKMDKEEEQREVERRTEVIEQIWRVYIIPLIVTILVIIFCNISTYILCNA